MSEYQYYEFIAIDKPLTTQKMAELRSVSSRADITATSFVNEYNWGNFKGDPADWIRRYFDAFVYTANWCSCQFMLRVPLNCFSLKTIQDTNLICPPLICQFDYFGQQGKFCVNCNYLH